MKIGVYDPYLDTLGGGERYMMSLAACLAKKHQVEVFWDDASLKKKLEARLGLDLAKINFAPNIFNQNFFQKKQATELYDVLIYLSDGSLPFLFAKKNILHFQVPFQNVGGKSLLNKIKLRKIGKIICNSSFTKRFIDQEFGVDSQVVYPPVAVDAFKPGKKKNLILSVARFSQAMQAKKQEILIQAFKKLAAKGWQLVLAGGLRSTDRRYFENLEKQAAGLPVELLANVSFVKLQQLYGQAKIFWHAAGFGESEAQHPEKMEHFGIVVVEAMAAGCVPVVIGKGGIPEIITPGQDGFLWQTPKELIEQTNQLINSPQVLQKLSQEAIKSSQRFSEANFCQKIHQILNLES